ncbi:hypothetical protein GW17_00029283 [Ensete ventricosum]|nr:hypothetical protein GW17_00029283 [Ensete ventricosum]RZS18232.1 hypothetical protein BHM03_00050466 [Ensete ventricosum]
MTQRQRPHNTHSSFTTHSLTRGRRPLELRRGLAHPVTTSVTSVQQMDKVDYFRGGEKTPHESRLRSPVTYLFYMIAIPASVNYPDWKHLGPAIILMPLLETSGTRNYTDALVHNT